MTVVAITAASNDNFKAMEMQILTKSFWGWLCYFGCTNEKKEAERHMTLQLVSTASESAAA